VSAAATSIHLILICKPFSLLNHLAASACCRRPVEGRWCQSSVCASPLNLDIGQSVRWSQPIWRAPGVVMVRAGGIELKLSRPVLAV